MYAGAAIVSLAYLATPYTNYMPDIEAAFVAACKLAARLIEKEVSVYSPIAHSHPIALHGGLDPLNHAMWIAFDEAMMEKCDTLIVAFLPGWQVSKGVAHEIEFFQNAGKKIWGLDPATCRMERWHYPGSERGPRVDESSLPGAK